MTVTTLPDHESVRFMRSIRVEANYGAVPWACPESVAVEWTEPDDLDADQLRGVIAQLAAVPASARPHDYEGDR